MTNERLHEIIREPREEREVIDSLIQVVEALQKRRMGQG